MKLIGQGAEAKLFLDKDKVVKDRITKKYRIPEIDNRIRGFRTRREAKVISKLSDAGVPVPKLIDSDDKERIVIEYIDGTKLRDVLDKKNYEKLMKELGEDIALLHNNDIIHGDLTTSNFIFKDKIYFIDFGLSFFSHKIEDKAVDLHLLKQALESKHYEFWEDAYKVVLDNYKKKADKGEEIIERLEKVESRGRYKGKKVN